MGLIDKIIDKVLDAATSKVGAAILAIGGAVIAAGVKGGSETEKCPYCGGVLKYHDSELEYFQYWECKKCGQTFYEEELSAEKEEPEEEESSYASTVDDILDIPEGCRACGGDYPNCMSSCNMFED